MATIFDLLSALQPNGAAPPLPPLAAGPPAQGGPLPAPGLDAPSTPADLSGVSVTATRKPVGTPAAATAYDNSPELQAISDVQKKYAEHTGMFGVHGTMRSLLGTLGDAFLVQSGNKPVYAPQVQREKIADAMVGFHNDPGLAAERVASTAAPDSADIADKIQEQAQRNKQILAQQENLNAYRESMVQARQGQSEDRARAVMGGTMAAAAQANTPAAYAAARAQAIKIGQARIKDFDETDIPETLQQFNSGGYAGMGLTAQQVARNRVSEDSIDERGTAAGQAHQDRMHGQDNSNSAYMQGLARKVNAGETLAPGDQAIWDHNTKAPGKSHLSIPGLSPPSSGGGGGKKLVIRNGQIVQQ